MIVSGGEDGAISAAQLVSRRAFSGYWEYHVDGALFTAPARADHSGAGLFNGRGELVGIGSLLVSDALGPGAPQQNGNMFVPIDLLKPILPELRSRGSSAPSRRAWMGVNCVEAEGAVRVVRVNGDSPAEVAGLEPGDRIVRIDGTEVKALEVLWKTLWAGGAPEREVTLDIVRGGEPQTLKLQSVDRMKTLQPARRGSERRRPPSGQQPFGAPSGSAGAARSSRFRRRLSRRRDSLMKLSCIGDSCCRRLGAADARRRAAGRTGRPPGRSSRPCAARCRR